MKAQPSDCAIKSAVHWRKQAADMRTLATAAVDRIAKEKFFSAARCYEQLEAMTESQAPEEDARDKDLRLRQLELDTRFRERNGEISVKYGDASIGLLRKIYGRGFAPGCENHERLSDVLPTMNKHSLFLLLHDHHAGDLKKKVSEAKAA
jgi:hypothetical protein